MSRYDSELFEQRCETALQYMSKCGGKAMTTADIAVALDLCRSTSIAVARKLKDDGKIYVVRWVTVVTAFAPAYRAGNKPDAKRPKKKGNAVYSAAYRRRNAALVMAKERARRAIKKGEQPRQFGLQDLIRVMCR